MYHAKDRLPYTLEEYWRLVETFPNHKYEYISGYVRMMTGDRPAHAQLQARLGHLLDAALQESACDVYGSSATVRIAEGRYYHPDASVSYDLADRVSQQAITSPKVVIEILSPSTAQIDKIEKLSAYQAASSIQDILLVDSRKRYIEHYHRVLPYPRRKWEYTIYTEDDEAISLEGIGVNFSVGDVYYKVYLEEEMRAE